MSNWSRVIVCWGGTDDEASEDKEVRRRAIVLVGDGWRQCVERITYSCGPRTTGSACEVVVTLSMNHFDEDRLADLLRSMKWEHPREVEFFWKNEEDERYRHVVVFPDS